MYANKYSLLLPPPSPLLCLFPLVSFRFFLSLSFPIKFPRKFFPPHTDQYKLPPPPPPPYLSLLLSLSLSRFALLCQTFEKVGCCHVRNNIITTIFSHRIHLKQL